MGLSRITLPTRISQSFPFVSQCLIVPLKTTMDRAISWDTVELLQSQ